MSDILIVIIGGLFSIVTGAVGYFVALYRLKPEVKLMGAQEKKELSVALKNSVDALVANQEFEEARDKMREAREKELENRVQQLEEHRDMRAKQIEELKAKDEEQRKQIGDLNNRIAIDTKETIVLRGRVAEMDVKYNRMRRVNEKLVVALNEAKIPLPDFNGDLTDSIESLRLIGK